MEVDASLTLVAIIYAYGGGRMGSIVAYVAKGA